MGGRKPGLTRARHEEIGPELDRICHWLLTVGVEVANAYPTSSHQYRAGMRAAASAETLRHALDEAIHAEHPRADGHEALQLIRVYYPRGTP